LQNSSLGASFGFVNGDPHLKDLREQPNAMPRQKVINEIFSGIDRTRIDAERRHGLRLWQRIGDFLAQAYEHMAGPNHANIISPDHFETLKMTSLRLRWAQDVA
jgi:hypothetical protein